MNKPCLHINQAIDIALYWGNRIYSVNQPTIENNKLVVDLCEPISSNVKMQIDTICNNIRFWSWKGVPHNPSENGYTCDECNVVLIFPNVKTPCLKK